LQPSLIEDQDEARDADSPREHGVVELDPTWPVRTEQHPETEEGDQHRQSRPCRDERDHDARGKNCSHDQQQGPLVHGAIFLAAGPEAAVGYCSSRSALAAEPTSATALG
jgi:hypothetical protein